MAINLPYTIYSNAESNRSDYLKLKAEITNLEDTNNYYYITIKYTINKTTDSAFTIEGKRYGLLVGGANIQGGYIKGYDDPIIIAYQQIYLTDSGSSKSTQTGTIKFSIKKENWNHSYSNVIFLINDNINKVNFNNDYRYLWTGERGGSIKSERGGFGVIGNITIPAISYTNCTPPTSITTNKNIQVPNQNVTISWSGASGGKNNSVSKYEVYWRNGSEPALDNFTNMATTSSTSYNFTMPNNRGGTYYFKVRAIGSAGNSYASDLSTVYTTVKVNQLPSAPTVTNYETIVPSYGRNVSFNLSASDPDGTNPSFYYSIGNGAKTSIANNGSIYVNSTQTYNFYSYDGLEYSSPSSVTINVNTKPEIVINVEGDPDYKYSSDLLISDYQDNFYTKFTGNVVSISNNCSVYWCLRYAYLSNIGDISTWQRFTLKISNDSQINFDLSSYEYFKDKNGIVYQIGAYCNDGIENSVEYWCDKNFVIAPLPEIKENFFNNYDKKNVDYSKLNNFYRNASIEADKDTSVTSIVGSIIKPDNSSALVSINSNEINSYKDKGYFNMNITNTTPNTNYELKITINRVIGSISKTFNITSTGLPQKSGGSIFSASDIIDQTEILHPYENNSNNTFDIILYNFFETVPYTNSNVNYNGSNLPSSCLEFYFIKGSKFLPFTPTKIDSINNAEIRFTYRNNFYADELLNNKDPLELNLNDINTIDLKIIFKDVFEQEYELIKPNYLTLDFREPFTDDSTFNVEVLRDGNSLEDTSDNTYKIQENDKLKFNFDWRCYNSQIATIESYIYRSSNDNLSELTNINWERYPDSSSYIWTIDTNTTGTVIEGSLIRKGIGSVTYNIGQINKSNYVYFKIVTYLNGKVNEFIITDPRITQRHVPIPNLSFASVSYVPPEDKASNGKIVFSHNPYDSGGGTSPSDSSDTAGGINKIEFGIQYSTDFESSTSDKKYVGKDGGEAVNFTSLINVEGENLIKLEQTSDASYESIFINTEWSYYRIRLVARTTINSIEKISYGEVVTIYNITPTVCYRPNQIGINIRPENFSSDISMQHGVVYVQASSGKNMIYLCDVGRAISISLKDGTVDNVVINGGTWDNSENIQSYSVLSDAGSTSEEFYVMKEGE